MVTRDIVLVPSDPTVFTKCERCCRQGVGSRTDKIYAIAFSKAKWARKPKCENCKGQLTFLYEIS